MPVGVRRRKERTANVKEQGEMSNRVAPAARIRASRAISLFWLCTLALLLLGLSSPAAKAAPAERDADNFRILASELAVDLDRLSMDRGGGMLTVAVWPYAMDRGPLPPQIANELNDRLLSALLAVGGHRHRFVARDALRVVVEDVAESSDLASNLDRLLSALADRAKADVLVVSKLRDLGDGRVLLSYRAVDVEDGTIVAATSHRELAMGPADMSRGTAAMSLDEALRDAVGLLSDRVEDLESLHLQGIEFEHSGRETPFGRYVEGRLADGLSERYEHPIRGRSITLRYNGPTKGLTEVAEKGLHDLPGAYRLSGHYWDFGEVIELRLSLQDHQGPAAVWRERIQTASVPKALRRLPLDGFDPRDATDRGRSLPVAAAPRREPETVAKVTKKAVKDSSPLVRQVQRRLQYLGYGPGAIDGVYGPRTRAAIRKYQDEHGLLTDGLATAALARHLDTKKRPTPKPTSLVAAQTGDGGIKVRKDRVRGIASTAHAQAAPQTIGSGVRWNIPQNVYARRQASLRRGAFQQTLYCRDFVQSVTIGGRRQQAFGRACQQADGSWQVVSR